ncbi:MAG: DUF456 family protein [Bacillota bacterium]|nr:DUF456 family protein [Bacillota bacterium]
MEMIYWVFIVVLFAISFIGLIYPIIPSALFLLAGFLVYGGFFGFQRLSWFFWVIQGFFIILLFGADYLANLISIKKYGGSKAAIWGSTIGMIIGPFVIPFLGIIIGPFIGAVAAEILVHKKNVKSSIKIGFGTIIGLISSIATKTIIQIIMVAYFVILVTK